LRKISAWGIRTLIKTEIDAGNTADPPPAPRSGAGSRWRERTSGGASGLFRNPTAATIRSARAHRAVPDIRPYEDIQVG
jgi:hypothetical protein